MRLTNGCFLLLLKVLMTICCSCLDDAVKLGSVEIASLEGNISKLFLSLNIDSSVSTFTELSSLNYTFSLDKIHHVLKPIFHRCSSHNDQIYARLITLALDMPFVAIIIVYVFYNI